METNKKTRKRAFHNFIINNLLMVTGCSMIISGLILQIGFHMGDHPAHPHQEHGPAITDEPLRVIESSKIVWGFNYPNWSTIHKIAVVLFTLLILYHIFIHWKWVQGMITKHLIIKNHQVIILSACFLVVAVTGFIPWLIDIYAGSGHLRMLFIEIHDKITYILIIYLILHVAKRVRWFATTYTRLKNA